MTHSPAPHSTRSSSLVLSIPTPRDSQDAVVLDLVAPLLRALPPAPSLEAVWFERYNKPEWGIRIRVMGAPAWLETQARPTLAACLGSAASDVRFTEEPSDDKWLGRHPFTERLAAFHEQDTRACVEALEADRDGRLGSRVRFSLVVVEGLLNACGLHDAARMAFYQRSFEWAIANGRWDREVLESLERTLVMQRKTFADVIADDHDCLEPHAWPSAEAGRIGRALLLASRDSLASAELDRLELATFAARAHSNRLGLHASREAALRYLMWRVRGGAAIPARNAGPAA